MTTPINNPAGPFDWKAADAFGPAGPRRTGGTPPRPRGTGGGGGVYGGTGNSNGAPNGPVPSGPSRERVRREQEERARQERDRLYDVTGRTAYLNGQSGQGGQGGRGGGGGRSGKTGAGTGAAGNGGSRHQGDRLIAMVERIEIGSDRDVLALAQAINHLGRELHLILGMRAEELNGVLSTYKGKWYTFGASSRVKARLVSAHLKVSAEAAKALGVGALKCAHAFHRHFVLPEQEARQRSRSGGPTRRQFTIGDD
ncbi:hypothetical protein [Streptomyces chumphonensis]|uniref:hypothetical protein n=1 Tax=Streptomyces chumphonensis TaxID=1214925 RepID=UPI003D739DBE